MSIATDIVSLKIIAELYEKKNSADVLSKTVHSLVEEVAYIDWAGIYYYENGDQAEANLIASSSSNERDLEYKSVLKFPIKTSHSEEIGMLVVKAKEVIAFDVTDISTLEVIAAMIGEKTLTN